MQEDFRALMYWSRRTHTHRDVYWIKVAHASSSALFATLANACLPLPSLLKLVVLLLVMGKVIDEQDDGERANLGFVCVRVSNGEARARDHDCKRQRLVNDDKIN